MVFSKAQNQRGNRGFTLIEMLAVMLIIALLLGIGVNLVKDLSSGKTVSSGVALAEGVFDQARVSAISSGAPVRVVLHDDPSEEERFRNYLAIAQRGLIDASNGTFTPDPNGDWVVTSSGYDLPGGVFFDVQTSSTIGANLSPGVMTIRLPGDNVAAVNCRYFEFNSEGLMVDPGPGVGFVLFRGVYTPGSGDPVPEGGNNQPVDNGGFVVWRHGNTSRIQGNSQLNN